MQIPERVLQVGYGLLDKASDTCTYERHLISRTLYLQGLVPDIIIRIAIRALCRQRLREIDHGSFERNHEAKMQWIEAVRSRTKIADLTEKANEQHYEVTQCFDKFIVSSQLSLGVDQVHTLVLRALREVFVLLLPYWPGNTRRSRSSYVGKLLYQG